MSSTFLDWAHICNFPKVHIPFGNPKTFHVRPIIRIEARNLSFSYYLLEGGLYPVRPLCAGRSEGPGAVGVPEDLQPIMVVE
jgi:hypothetical protein